MTRNNKLNHKNKLFSLKNEKMIYSRSNQHFLSMHKNQTIFCKKYLKKNLKKFLNFIFKNVSLSFLSVDKKSELIKKQLLITRVSHKL